MSGPWYQERGPSAQEVRNDVINILKKDDNIKYHIDNNDILQKVLHEIIPDTKTDFGSYRGYITFGTAKELAKEVNTEYCKVLCESNYCIMQ